MVSYKNIFTSRTCALLMTVLVASLSWTGEAAQLTFKKGIVQKIQSIFATLSAENAPIDISMQKKIEPYWLLDSQVDILLGERYQGQYDSGQQAELFDYLKSSSGVMNGYFYSDPYKVPTDMVNNLQLFLFDPIYHDERAIGILINLDPINGTIWSKTSASIQVARFWKQRNIQEEPVNNVNYQIQLFNVQGNDPSQVTIKVIMSGPLFEFSCLMSYQNETASTVGYSLYVTFIVGIQIACAFMLLKSMQGGNPALMSKISLLTISLCNIQDFNMTMNHVQYIMSTGTGYLYFIFPSMAYVILFVIFDMKILFIVWRGHHTRDIENPQQLRKKLTTFYIQFYLGLFLYLTLSYFFAYDFWLIILQNLILLPQIVRNARIGNNPGFSSFYIFGYLGTRFMIPFYERGCPANHFLLSPDPVLVSLIAVMYFTQILILFLQFKLGSRFFVPKMLLPNYYNYNTKLRLNETTQDYECTICIQNLFASPEAISSAINSSLNSQFVPEVNAMRTPCNHYFHRDCLVQWMDVKLECPTCRALLPAI